MTAVLHKPVVLKVLGIVALAAGLAMLPPLLLAWRWQEFPQAAAFGGVATGCMLLGLTALSLTRGVRAILRIRDSLFIVLSSWLLVSLIGALPYLLTGTLSHWSDAFFESVSGFTTTGTTLLTNLEQLPGSLLLWRSFCQWIGGLGVIIFIATLLPAPGISDGHLLQSETRELSLHKLDARHKDSSGKLLAIYAGLTMLQILLLKLGRLSFFRATLLSLGSMASSGLPLSSDGLLHSDSLYIDSVLAFFMLASCIHFPLYHYLLRKDFKAVKKNAELRVLLSLFLCSGLLVSLNLVLSRTFASPAESLRYGFFHAASYLTTTGMTPTGVEDWPLFSRLILLLLSFAGGSSASTGGGLKIIRIIVLWQLIRRSFMLHLHPRAVQSIKVEGEPVSSTAANAIVAYFFTFITLFFAAAFVLSFWIEDLETSLFTAAAMLCNTGAGHGLLSSQDSLLALPAAAKLFLSFLMLCGRLEIHTVFLLFTRAFWHPGK